MSRKAAGAFAASAAAAHSRPSKKSHFINNNNDMYATLKSPDDENNQHESTKPLKSPTLVNSNNKSAVNNGNNNNNKKAPPYQTKGVAMSFGFRRRPTTAPSIASNASAARRLANAVDCTAAKTLTTDRNGNEDDTQSLTGNSVPVGRSTPRLAPPKKEPNATQRVSRFGYRDKVNRLSRVADLNGQFDYNNTNPASNNLNTTEKRTNYSANVKIVDNNKNTKVRSAGIPQPTQGIGRYTLQTTQLPRPESVRLIETKTAKTLANNNRKVQSCMYRNPHEDVSSKDGSLTEDSGVGSNHSGNDMPAVEKLDASPTFRRRPHPNYHYQKPRSLEVVKTGANTFDVRDVDTNTPLPQLPTAYNAGSSRKNSYQTTGLVRERTFEYQRYLDRDNRRKISVTSSEGYSDDYADEQKTFHDRICSEKTFLKPKTFLKATSNQKIEMDRLSLRADDSSPPSSDEHDWMQAGEAMADETSISLSSSDESRDKMQLPIGIRTAPSSRQANTAISAALQNLMATSLTKPFNKNDTKNVLLSIEDPKFAAVANSAASTIALDNETLLSPGDISYTESEEYIKRKSNSSSNSKDINEKATPPSPGTPTNASNSLSLSDGKDDFLIDDEIADQPALVFEDRSLTNASEAFSQNTSENTPTMVDSPKPRRKPLQPFDSPLMMKNKKFLESRTGSLDTLSPCESIASDDLMMDFDYSQSSGLDECDNRTNGYSSLPEIVNNRKEECMENKSDLSFLSATLVGSMMNEKLSKNGSRSRLLQSSRTSTPNSIPDSPRSFRTGRPSVTASPIRSRLGQQLSNSGYESDDSIRLDRANHTAMKQDIMSIKTMLLKLRRVLNESETHNPFDSQATLTNGLFNNDSSSACCGQIESDDAQEELAELRKQVLFLQGQLEDKEKSLQTLQEQVIKMTTDSFISNSAPASTIAYSSNSSMCNAATQTERVRPISAGPSLINGSSTDANAGSLVSVNEPSASNAPSPSRRSRPPQHTNETTASKRTPSRLWRKPGEPPSPQRYANSSTATSSIPRRANSRSRTPSSTPT